MNKQPRLLDVSQLRDIFTPHYAEIRENIYFSEELGLIHGDPKIFHLVLSQKPPFSINDHRFGIVVKGEAVINLNLQDRHIVAGMLVYLGPGTIITPISISDDLEIYGVALFADFPMPFAPGQLPSSFNGQVRDFQLPASDVDKQTVLNILNTLWNLVRQKDYPHLAASSLVAALMHYYDALYHRQSDQQSSTKSREQTIFDRYIQLVNQHCTEHHQLGYYANRMCITQRYLGTVVRQASGVTAKEWIDRALVTRIKIELRHTDKSAAQIADEMNFPNPSFFSKYFRRLAGMTPHEYKLR